MTSLNFPPTACWIGSAHPFDLHEVYLDFRSPAFVLADEPRTADLLITADSRYRLWLNGRFVGRGPARCYPWRQAVDSVEVSAYLRPGANVVAVQVYQPGYSHFAYVHRAAAGVLAWLRVDGATHLLTTTAWRVRCNRSFSSGVPRISIYGSGVEDRAMIHEDAWTEPAYEDSTWEAARVVAPVGGYPWTGMVLRDLPSLEECELSPHLDGMRCATGISLIGPDMHAALCQAWQRGEPEEPACDADGWHYFATAEHEATTWLYDLGRDYASQGWVEVIGATGGETLLVSYAEKTRNGELVLSDPATYCRVRLTDRFALRAGSQVLQSFSLRGGRYVLFALGGPANPDLRLRFHVRAVDYALAIDRPLRLDDPDLQAVVDLCERTFRACLQDGFVDSTWRESSQWVGDALPQALIMHALSDDVRPLRQVLRMAADGAYPDGVLPGVAPGEVHAYTVVDYNFTWVELLDLYWRLSGDRDLVAALWPALVKMLDRFAADVHDDGLIRSQPGRRLFLDWAPVSRREPSAIYNLHYLLALQHAAHLAHDLDAGEDARRWAERAATLRAACRVSFWQNGRWWDDTERTTASQLAAALAVLTGAAKADEWPAQLDAIAARSLDLDDDPQPGALVLASPFMHHYLFEALRAGGWEPAVVEIIRRRWGRWADAGCPTTWENWNVDFPDGSTCHAFSAHPLYHLYTAAQSLPL